MGRLSLKWPHQPPLQISWQLRSETKQRVESACTYRKMCTAKMLNWATGLQNHSGEKALSLRPFRKWWNMVSKILTSREFSQGLSEETLLRKKCWRKQVLFWKENLKKRCIKMAGLKMNLYTPSGANNYPVC